MTILARTAYAVATVCAAVAAVPAGAAVLVEQVSLPNPGGTVSSGSRQAFEDFRLAETSTINGIEFWAFFEPAAGVTKTFEVSFWNVASTSFPDLIAGPIATRSITVDMAAAGDYLAFASAGFGSGVLLAGGTNYFVSVYSDSGFTWARSNDVAPGVYNTTMNVSLNRTTGVANLNATNVGFRLLGDVGVPPVPEPATWAMMIAGFGLVGGAMRRRVPATLA